MMERLKYKLKEFNSKSAINKDFYVKTSFPGEQMLFPPGEINHIVNAGEQFIKERNESTIYRINGTVTPIFSNPLMNINTTAAVPTTFGSGSISKQGNGLDIFNNEIFRLEPFDNNFVGTPNLTFRETLDTKLLERNGWFGFTDPDTTKIGLESYYDIEPTKERFNLSSYGDKNWELTITYPARKNGTHDLVQGGLKIVGAEEVEVGGVPMVAIATSTYHGLSNGNKVRLSGMTHNEYNGDFTVKRLGLDNGDLRFNYFVIDADPSIITSDIINGRMKKVVSGFESEYYIRHFEKLLKKDGDYEMYQLGFSRNVYDDPNFQFVINEDLDIADIKDNLGRPLSELYVTLVKTSSDNMFHKIQSGFDLEFLTGNIGSDRTVSNIRQITYDAATSQVALESNLIMSSSNDFYGDIVEYNKVTLKEIILSDVLHRFNCNNREKSFTNGAVKGPRREGYLYKPHHLIKIRDFSAYIEQGNSNTVGIPDYAENLGDGRWLWRDLLDIGIFEGQDELLDYPFTNGVHYIHQNYCFKTTRQDPFSAYGLFHFGSGLGADEYDPADPAGDSINDDFTVRRSDNDC